MTPLRAGFAGLLMITTSSFARAQATSNAPDSVVITVHYSGFLLGTGRMRVYPAGVVDFTLHIADTSMTLSHYTGCTRFRDTSASERSRSLGGLAVWADAIAAGQAPPRERIRQ